VAESTWPPIEGRFARKTLVLDAAATKAGTPHKECRTTPDQMSNTSIASVWLFLKRTFSVVVILISTVCLLANTAGLVGVWVVRRPACNSITKLAAFVNEKLGTIDQALTRVGERAEDGRKALTPINNAASKLSDRLEENRPLFTALTDAARETLSPKIAEIRTQATALHDGVISVNGALETLDSLGLFNVPTFTDELSAVSGRIDALEENVQDWRAAIEEARAGASAKLVDGIISRTTKLDDVMTQIQSATVKYQATVAEKRQQVTDLSHRLLRIINLLVVVITAFFLVVAAGQVMLIQLCWRYLRPNKPSRATSAPE
jgi:hypothetical protein